MLINRKGVLMQNISKIDFVVKLGNGLEFIVGSERRECCLGGELKLDIPMMQTKVLNGDDYNIFLTDFNYIDFQEYKFRVQVISNQGYVWDFIYVGDASVAKDGVISLVLEENVEKDYFDIT